jgi:hypothetical protein
MQLVKIIEMTSEEIPEIKENLKRLDESALINKTSNLGKFIIGRVFDLSLIEHNMSLQVFEGSHQIQNDSKETHCLLILS